MSTTDYLNVIRDNGDGPKMTVPRALRDVNLRPMQYR